MGLRGYFICMFFMFAAGTPVRGQEQIFKFADGKISHALRETSEFLMDAPGNLTIGDVVKPDKVWVPMTEKPAGYRDEVFWFRSRLRSEATKQRHLIFLFKNPLILNMEVFALQGDGRLSRLDVARGSEPRFELSLSPGEDATIYIRVKFPYQSNAPLRVYDEESLQFLDLIEHLYVFASLGLLFGLLIYNLFVFVSLRELSHFCYLIYAGAAFVVAIFQSGYSQMVFGDSWLWINNIVNQLAIIGAVVFARVFMNTRTRAPRLNQLMSVILVMSVAHMVICLFAPSATLLYVFELTLGIASFSVVTAGVIAYRQGFPPAKYYLLSWVLLISAAWFWMASNFGLISDGFYAPFAMNLGVTLEMNLISVALAERVNMLRRELIGALQNANAELERRVQAEAAVIKRQQVTLVNSAKMSALGQMASGIAHEINNPLTIIRGRASLIRYAIEAGKIQTERFVQDLDVIESTSVRIAKITRGLLAFAGGEEDDPPAKSDIKTVVEDTLRYCVEKFKAAGIAIDMTATGDTEVVCRSQQIGHVVLALLNNAFDAVSELPEKWIKIEVIGDDKQVMVRTTDSGPGIPAEIVDRIMDPFFTTKDVGKGTGLGLSVSKGVLDEHGGQLYVDRAVANTCIVFTLIKTAETPVKQPSA